MNLTLNIAVPVLAESLGDRVTKRRWSTEQEGCIPNHRGSNIQLNTVQ